MKEHGPWKIVASQIVYSDPWTELRKDDVIRPDGKAGTHSVVRIKPGISVLAIDEDDSVYLTDEFHYAVGRHSLEVVSGGIDPGETALEAAQRELREEIGIDAAEWSHVGTVDPFTSSLVSLIATAMMGLAAYLTLTGVDMLFPSGGGIAEILSVGIPGLVGVGTYLALLMGFQVEEIQLMWSAIQKRLPLKVGPDK